MLFNTWGFFYFLLISLIIYYLPFLRKYQPYILIIISLVFYLFAGPIAFIFLLITFTINILAIIFYIKSKNRLIIITSIIINILILAFFKYSSYLYTSIPQVLRTDQIEQFLISIPIPLGISFFIFQLISILSDSTKEKTDKFLSQNNKLLVRNLFFTLIFFPKIISGPIVRINNFYKQIESKLIKDIDWYGVFKFLLFGFFFKMVVADGLRFYTKWISYPEFTTRPGSLLIIYTFAFSIQLYADFAGYTMTAIGIAKLFGYNLPRNFDYPYISRSFTEFWRRWHITLSSWLRDYLYIPLGGNRKGKKRTYLNLLVVMVIGGLWHGSTVLFALWGLLHGLALATERFVMQHSKIKFKNRVVELFQIFLTFSLVSILWVFFRLNNLQEIIEYLKALTNQSIVTDVNLIFSLILYTLPILLYHIYGYLEEGRIKNFIYTKRYIVFGTMLFLLIFNAADSNEFIYFQF